MVTACRHSSTCLSVPECAQQLSQHLQSALHPAHNRAQLAVAADVGQDGQSTQYQFDVRLAVIAALREVQQGSKAPAICRGIERQFSG